MQTNRKSKSSCVGVLLACSLAEPAFATSQCPPPGHRPPAPQVELAVSAVEAVVHNHRGRAEITRLAGNEGLGVSHNAGLTRSRTEFRIEPRAKVARLPDGRACVMLDRVTASWRLVEMTVDVAAEYAPGSCAYREVKAHEDEHVRITDHALRRFAPILEARLKRAAAALAPTMGRDGAEVLAAMAEKLKAASGEVLAEFQAELGRRQAAIDTPESYRAVSRRCDRW